MARKIKVAAIQASFGMDLAANIARTAELIRDDTPDDHSNICS